MPGLTQAMPFTIKLFITDSEGLRKVALFEEYVLPSCGRVTIISIEQISIFKDEITITGECIRARIGGFR